MVFRRRCWNRLRCGSLCCRNSSHNRLDSGFGRGIRRLGWHFFWFFVLIIVVALRNNGGGGGDFFRLFLIVCGRLGWRFCRAEHVGAQDRFVNVFGCHNFDVVQTRVVPVVAVVFIVVFVVVVVRDGVGQFVDGHSGGGHLPQHARIDDRPVAVFQRIVQRCKRVGGNETQLFRSHRESLDDNLFLVFRFVQQIQIRFVFGDVARAGIRFDDFSSDEFNSAARQVNDSAGNEKRTG